MLNFGRVATVSHAGLFPDVKWHSLFIPPEVATELNYEPIKVPSL